MSISPFAVLLAITAPTPGGVVLDAPATITDADDLHIRLTGLVAREPVVVHSIRRFGVWEKEDASGRWVERPRILHAWAEYRAGDQGLLDTSRARPLRATFPGRAVSGLLWSGRRKGAPELSSVALPELYETEKLGTAVALAVTQSGKVVARREVGFAPPKNLFVGTVEREGLNGVFAAPEGARALPTLILLHGSEGGGRDQARNLAMRYAAQGYAALAVNWFAWDLANLKNTPFANADTPIEVIERARDWLRTRPEADVERIGLYGHSKGAELATLAAVRLPWIDAVAACVPSDVIWEGYGLDDERNKPENRRKDAGPVSSWSWKGQSLPFIPLRTFVWGQASPYFDNTERYELSRTDHPERAALAAIPIERASAKFLLLGADRDEVWASGKMTRALRDRMRNAGRAKNVEAIVYERAGHQICGDGTYPPRVYAEDAPDRRRKELTAEGLATIDAWQRVRAFFARTLK